MKVLKALDGRAATDLEMRKRVRSVRTNSMRNSNQRLRRGEFGNDIRIKASNFIKLIEWFQNNYSQTLLFLTSGLYVVSAWCGLVWQPSSFPTASQHSHSKPSGWSSKRSVSMVPWHFWSQSSQVLLSQSTSSSPISCQHLIAILYVRIKPYHHDIDNHPRCCRWYRIPLCNSHTWHSVVV
jgi:hypothetical protein